MAVGLAGVLALGGCAAGARHERSDASGETPSLSTGLARFRAAIACDANDERRKLLSVDRDTCAATGGRSSVKSDIPADARFARSLAATRALPPHRDARLDPFPRALDPVPPLYVPPSTTPALQPVLDAPPAGAHETTRVRRPLARRDPLGAADPLRRIDPLTGRDPLGRFDPSAGVDFRGGGR